MLRLLACLLLIGVCGVYAQRPFHCFSPPELTFKAHEFNHPFTTFRWFDGVYDARFKRIAYMEKVREFHVGQQQVWIIFLHDEGVIFEINLKTRECKKFPAHTFIPFGVPENARFDAEYYIGGPGEDVEVTEWSDRISTRRETWGGVFTKSHCLPVRTFLLNNYRNHTLTTSFYDVVEGVAFPDWFIPPRECDHARMEEEPSKTVRNLATLNRGG